MSHFFDHNRVPEGRQVPLTLLALAGPIIASMVSRTAMNFIDFLMVAELGMEYMAAITAAGMVLFTITGFGMGAVMLVNTLVGQSYGSGRFNEAMAYAWQGVYLGLLLGLGVLPLYWAMPGLFAWIGHAPAVQQLEIDYAEVVLLSVGPNVIALALAGFFNGVHRPAVGFWAVLIANGFNVLANFALIYGHFGFPAMGMAGAAWATTLGAALQCVILVGWLARPVYRAYHPLRNAAPSPAKFWHLLRVGAPTGLHFTGDIVVFAVFVNLLAGRFGTASLAATNTAVQWMHVAFMPAIGLGNALTAAFGKAIGQGRVDIARQFTQWALLINMAYMGLIGAAFILLPEPLLRMMKAEDPVVAVGVPIMVYCGLFQIFDAMNVTYISALRGAGDTAVPSAIGIGTIFVICLGGGWAAVEWFPQFGARGPWFCMTVYVIVLGLALMARYLAGGWQRIDLLNRA